MFAGIIETVGTVVAVDATPRRHGDGSRAHRLTVELGHLAEGLPRGASVAVNGACLTLAESTGSHGSFDVVPQTWQHTTLRHLQRGQSVNLERALAFGDRIDGHFVQGHIDGIANVERVDRTAGQWKLWVRAPVALMPYVVPQGSIALDGVSLTITDTEPASGRLAVALVPTTLDETTLGRRQPGDALNIETDILARLVVRRLSALAGGAGAAGTSAITWERLQQAGFSS